MRIREQRETIAQKIVNGREGETYVYLTVVDVAEAPAIVVNMQEPVGSNFNVSNRMGDEFRWRIWALSPVRTSKELAFDELDDLIYSDNGVRQILHHDTQMDPDTVLAVTGIREYGKVLLINSQQWVSAQVTVSVFTQG